jgi:hypothetical protein
MAMKVFRCLALFLALWSGAAQAVTMECELLRHQGEVEIVFIPTVVIEREPVFRAEGVAPWGDLLFLYRYTARENGALGVSETLTIFREGEEIEEAQLFRSPGESVRIKSVPGFQSVRCFEKDAI